MFKTNEYFEGNVKSLSFDNSTGDQTIGVMAEGEYEFATSTVEVMSVISGILTVQLPDSSEWKSYIPGDSFEVGKDKKFKVKVEEPSAYLCLYK